MIIGHIISDKGPNVPKTEKTKISNLFGDRKIIQRWRVNREVFARSESRR